MILNTGIIFALALQPKNLPMGQTMVNLEVKLLEKMYLEEVEILKLHILTGASGIKMKKQRRKTMELANMIHEKQFGTSAHAWKEV